jgi:hypothetical protein
MTMLTQDERTMMEQVLHDPMAGMRGGIGFVGLDLPIDLFAATGRPFGHLPWRADGATAWADRWLESGFPGWARHILEDWHAGRFDGLADVVFSRADDASQRLFYYVRELQQRGELAGPRALVSDIALLPRESSLAHTHQALQTLGAQLSVPEQDLPAAIDRVNALRRHLAALEAGRAADGAAFERFNRATLFSDATRWAGAVLPVPDEGRAPAVRGVLLAGSVPPDDRLHRAVEAGDACVVSEAHAQGLLRLGPPLDAGDESPWRAVAQHLRANSVGPRSPIDRARCIVDRARRAHASAVVLWLTREEESLAWHVPAQREALRAAGIPCLALTARRWQADDGATDQIARFCAEVLP